MTERTTTEAWRPTRASDDDARWRTRDIVVVAVIAAAFGVVFWAWNAAWNLAEPFFAFFLPARYVMYGVWLIPAVLAPYLVRKPGAALFAEMVAAAISTLLGSQWGPDTLLSGFVQGASAELVFAFTLYRNYSVPVLALAAVASAAAAWVHDWVLYFAALPFEAVAVIGLFMAISAAVIIPAASILLARSLHRAGVLEDFAP